MKLQNSHSTGRKRRFLNLYVNERLSTRAAAEAVGVSNATGYAWADEAGVIRSKSQAMRLYWDKQDRTHFEGPEVRVGVDWRTLQDYEDGGMPFQEALEKTLLEWCPEGAPSVGGNGLEVVRAATDGKTKRAA